jgi:hypothetical protein
MSTVFLARPELPDEVRCSGAPREPCQARDAHLVVAVAVDQHLAARVAAPVRAVDGQRDQPGAQQPPDVLSRGLRTIKLP